MHKIWAIYNLLPHHSTYMGRLPRNVANILKQQARASSVEKTEDIAHLS